MLTDDVMMRVNLDGTVILTAATATITIKPDGAIDFDGNGCPIAVLMSAIDTVLADGVILRA